MPLLPTQHWGRLARTPSDRLWKRLWRRFLAWSRWELTAVCELSAGLPPHLDYHDYPDDVHGTPAHFCLLTCKRCGKQFYI